MKKNHAYRKEQVSIYDMFGSPNLALVSEKDVHHAQKDLRDIGKEGKSKRLRKQWLRAHHMNAVLHGRVMTKREKAHIHPKHLRII